MEHNPTVDAFRAIADDVRLSVVRALAMSDRPLASCEIVSACAKLARLSQPAMSHHLTKLVAAGVVKEEKFGTQKRYRIDATFLSSIGIDVTKL